MGAFELDASGSILEQVAGFCEHGNEFLRFLKKQRIS
jgi:hypothetical protein